MAEREICVVEEIVTVAPSCHAPENIEIRLRSTRWKENRDADSPAKILQFLGESSATYVFHRLRARDLARQILKAVEESGKQLT